MVRGIGAATGIDLSEARDLARLLELAEDMEDVLAAEAVRKGMRVTAETSIPWEDIRAELGPA